MYFMCHAWVLCVSALTQPLCVFSERPNPATCSRALRQPEGGASPAGPGSLPPRCCQGDGQTRPHCELLPPHSALQPITLMYTSWTAVHHLGFFFLWLFCFCTLNVKSFFTLKELSKYSSLNLFENVSLLVISGIQYSMWSSNFIRRGQEHHAASASEGVQGILLLLNHCPLPRVLTESEPPAVIGFAVSSVTVEQQIELHRLADEHQSPVQFTP